MEDHALNKQREGIFNLLLSQNEGRPLIVSRANPKGLPTERLGIYHYREYDYRHSLPNEIIFDIGDSADWPVTVRQTDTLWKLLVKHEVPFWGALSGGRGTHTHVFTTQPEDREPFARVIYGLLWDAVGEEPDVDWGHLGRQLRGRGEPPLIREFGSRKRYSKTLIADHHPKRPENPPEIPSNRRDAYACFPLRLPADLPITEQPIGAVHQAISDALGGICPRSPLCYSNVDLDGFCSKCPVSR